MSEWFCLYGSLLERVNTYLYTLRTETRRLGVAPRTVLRYLTWFCGDTGGKGLIREAVNWKAERRCKFKLGQARNEEEID